MVYWAIKRNAILMHEVTVINSKNIVLSEEELYERGHCIWCHLHKVLKQAKLIHGGYKKVMAVACEDRNWVEMGEMESPWWLGLYLDKDLNYTSSVQLHKLKFHTCNLCIPVYATYLHVQKNSVIWERVERWVDGYLHDKTMIAKC